MMNWHSSAGTIRRQFQSVKIMRTAMLARVVVRVTPLFGGMGASKEFPRPYYVTKNRSIGIA